MINKFFSWPIRVHLIILVVLLTLPSVLLIVRSGIEARNEAIDEAKKGCLSLVNTIAAEQQAVVAGAEQLATALAFLPELQSRNSKAVSALFSDLVKKNPQYVSISVTDKSGSVWASAIPFEGKVSLADRKYFQEAVRTEMFSSGEYFMGRMAKKPVISFGYPVKNAANELIAVVVVVLDLTYAQNMFEKISLPPGVAFALLDHQGIIFIRNLKDSSSEGLIGKRDISEEMFTRIKEGPVEGNSEAMGNDGKPRILGYKRVSLPQESKPYLYVRSSIPLDLVTSRANTVMAKNVTLLLLVFGAALFLAGFIGKRVIMNPILLLKKASEELRAGADTLNVSQAVKGGELGELARAFDGMAEALVQRETALRQSEERWATTLVSIGDGVIATDTGSKITFMNAVAEGLTGWSLSEAATKPVTQVFNIINEHTRLEVDNPIMKVLREGMVVGLANHTILVRKDGTEVPIDDSGAPIRDKNGQTTGVVLVFRDVTERRQVEEFLRESEQRFRAIASNTPDHVLMQDRELRYTFVVNPQLGLTEQDMMGKTDYDILSKDDADRLTEIKRRVLETGNPVHLEAPLFSREGEQQFFDGSYIAKLNASGQIDGLVGYFRNVTERKKREVELSRLNRTLKALSDSDQAMMRAEDEAQFLESICRVIVEDCGHSMVWIGFSEEDEAKTVRPIACAGFEEGYLDTLHITWADTERGRGPTGTAIRTGKPSICRDMLTDPHFEPWREDALKRGYASSVVFPLIANGKTMGALTIYSKETNPFSANETDLLAKLADDLAYGITAIRLRDEHRRSEESLRRAHDELEVRVQERTLELSEAYENLWKEVEERKKMEGQLRQAQKLEAIGVLAGGIAHDFNNVLAGIIGFTEMVLEDITRDGPEYKKLELVLKGAYRGRDLVRQILTFSRQSEQNRKPMALNQIVEEGLKFLRPTLPSTIKIVSKNLGTDDRVLADPAQIHQILMNLCTNAAHAMREKGGILEVSISGDIPGENPASIPEVMPGEYVVLGVRDTGCGMTPETLERIFDPFFTTKALGEGTGLGLSVVHGIIKSHDGHVAVTSEPGRGTAFHVYLPKIKEHACPEDEAVLSAPRGKERILVVDDEDILVALNEQRLTRLGYDVVATTSSPDALDIFRKDPDRFDLVVTDQTMPNLTGIDLAAELLKVRATIPIILCTGHSDSVSPERAREAGIKAFLMKPLDKREMAEAIRLVLDTTTEG